MRRTAFAAFPVDRNRVRQAEARVEELAGQLEALGERPPLAARAGVPPDPAAIAETRARFRRDGAGSPEDAERRFNERLVAAGFAPDRADWIARLDQAVASAEAPPILVAHSLSCAMVACWAAAHTRPVRAALLVAPADVESDAHTPPEAHVFRPLPMAWRTAEGLEAVPPPARREHEVSATPNWKSSPEL